MAVKSLEELKKEKAKQSPQTNYALQTLYNIPKSSAQFVQDTITPILSPIDTAKNLIELGYGIYNLSTPGEQPSEETARAVGKYFYDRYGGEDFNQVKSNVLKTLKEDPIGFFADAALPLTIARAPLKTDSVIVKATKAIDPTEALIKATGAGYKFVRPSFAKLGGYIRASSGLGDGVLSTAYQAGRVGGDELAALREQMAQNTDIQTKAKPVMSYLEGLQNIAKKRRQEYLANMAKLGLDKIKVSPLEIRGIISESINEFTRAGKGTPKIKAKIDEINSFLNEWISDPRLHNVDGLDFFKQSLDDLKPAVTEQGRTGAFITDVQNRLKNKILEQSPEYANVMDAYSQSKVLQDQIKAALGADDITKIESIARKLQSTTRDNVSTSFGMRGRLLEELAAEGGQPLLPYQLAGQAIEPLSPRGIQKLTALPGASAAAYGALTGNIPLTVLAGLQSAATSPRLLGELAIQSGKVAGKVSPGLQKLYELYPSLDPYVKAGLRTTRAVEATGLSEAEDITRKKEFLKQFNR
jgi:hypothetical protein